jgi:hypothetical protein
MGDLSIRVSSYNSSAFGDVSNTTTTELWCTSYFAQEDYRFFGAAEALEFIQNDNAYMNVSDVFEGAVAYTFAGDNVFEDTLVSCPHFANEDFSNLQILPVSFDDSWEYGQTAMIQRVSLVSGDPHQSGLINTLPTNASLVSFRGAYMFVKGALIGSSDLVHIYAAESNWTEANISCLTQDSRFMRHSTCAHSEYDAASDVFANITHIPGGWAVADVSELVRCVMFDATNTTDTVAVTSLSFLWEAIGADSQPSQHVSQDINCEADALSGISGRTEWYTADSNNSPMLVMYFAND